MGPEVEGSEKFFEGYVCPVGRGMKNTYDIRSDGELMARRAIFHFHKS